MRIDAHQHFWKYDPVRDSWITEDMQVLRKDFMPADLKPILYQNKVDGTVAVQADQSDMETAFLLELAENNPFILGVVGWVDLMSDSLEEKLKVYWKHPKMKGFRHILQAEKPGFMTNPKFVAGVSKLASFGFTYDILVYHHQLSEVVELVRKLPKMRLVIDHIAKPDIKSGDFKTENFRSWSDHMKELAGFDHVSVKLSGMVTEASWNSWKPSDFEPYVKWVLDQFGIHRVMFGSDWPVCNVAGSYDKVVGLLQTCTSHLSTTEMDLLFGKNAMEFYDLKFN